jgi:hypothetical protein
MIQNKHAEAVQEASAIYPEFVSRHDRYQCDTRT